MKHIWGMADTQGAVPKLLYSDTQMHSDYGPSTCISEKAFNLSAIEIAVQSTSGDIITTSGDIITDSSKQMERSAEHYQELCLRKNIVTNRAIKNTLTIMEVRC
jgi:hypothetical protein